MTPKEEALELMNKFNNYHNTELKEYIIYQSLEESKRCALIAVDEIMYVLDGNESHWSFQRISYWEEVKDELEKL